MAYNTVPIKKDVDGKPIPQYYNAISNQYEDLQGANGANKVMVFDINGNIIDLTTLLTNIITAINTTATAQLRSGTNNIGKVDVNTSTLPVGASTAAKQDEIKAVVENIYNKDTTKTFYGLSTDTKPTANMVKGNVFFEINTSTAYMWNGTAWVVI